MGVISFSGDPRASSSWSMALIEPFPTMAWWSSTLETWWWAGIGIPHIDICLGGRGCAHTSAHLGLSLAQALNGDAWVCYQSHIHCLQLWELAFGFSLREGPHFPLILGDPTSYSKGRHVAGA